MGASRDSDPFQVAERAEESAGMLRLVVTKGRSERGVDVPDPDVRAIRRGLGMSQEAFARAFGFAKSSVCGWEQGRCRPEAATRCYLTVIGCYPLTVIRAIRSSQALLKAAVSADDS